MVFVALDNSAISTPKRSEIDSFLFHAIPTISPSNVQGELTMA